MVEKKEVLGEIAALVLKIQGDQSKVGTAIEAYDTKYLWDLGEQIRLYSSISGGEENAIQEIIDYFASRLVRFQPALLKKAETARRAFATREAYLELAQTTTYGKLRELLPVLDPDFAEQQQVPKAELGRLMGKLATLTYEEVLTEVRKIREKYDPSGISIDYDQLWEDMESAITTLGTTVTSADKDALGRYRSGFDPQFINDSRRLMAAMVDERNFQKVVAELPKRFGHTADTSADELQGRIRRVVYSLSLLRHASPSKREVLRQRVGKMIIGELSALMKAASSDAEMERYLRSRKMIEKLKIP